MFVLYLYCLSFVFRAIINKINKSGSLLVIYPKCWCYCYEFVRKYEESLYYLTVGIKRYESECKYWRKIILLSIFTFSSLIHFFLHFTLVLVLVDFLYTWKTTSSTYFQFHSFTLYKIVFIMKINLLIMKIHYWFDLNSYNRWTNNLRTFSENFYIFN